MYVLLVMLPFYQIFTDEARHYDYNTFFLQIENRPSLFISLKPAATRM